MKKNKIQKAIDEAEKIDYDKKGNAVISVGLKSKAEFYNPYCDNTYKMLNDDMLSYIELNARSIPNKKEISIEISTETTLSPEDKKQMKDTIQRQFAEKLTHQKRKLKFNLIGSLFLTIIGLGVLTLAVFLENLNISSILSNTIMIAAWVFIWDAVDNFFIKRPSMRMKYRLFKKLIKANVSIKKYQTNS